MMNANEVNEIINNICNKIGIGIDNAKQFVPALVKYEVIHNALWEIICAIIVICLLVIIKHLYLTRKKRMQNDSYFNEEPYDVGMFISGIFAVIFLLIACVYFVDMVEWLVSPNVKAVGYILKFIK